MVALIVVILSGMVIFGVWLIFLKSVVKDANSEDAPLSGDPGKSDMVGQ